LAYEILPKKYLDYIKKRLLVAAYGAVQPFANSPFFETFNTYSKEDVALFFGNKYHRWYSDYEISIVNSTPYQDGNPFPFPEGDHAFTGETYQKALINDLKVIKNLLPRSL
jgi:hypothetical protein